MLNNIICSVWVMEIINPLFSIVGYRVLRGTYDDIGGYAGVHPLTTNQN